jgi:hypothetical protein
MKEKILAAIKAKYPDVNLSKKRLDEIADKLSKKITDEKDIDAKLDELNELFPLADLAKQDDTIRDLGNKLKAATKNSTKKDGDKESESHEDDDDADTSKGKKKAKSESTDDTPAWAKEFATTMKTLSEKVSKMEAEKVAGSIQSQAKVKLKDIPEVFWKGRKLPDKEEELDDFVKDVTTDYGEFTTVQVENGMAAVPRPKGTNGKTKTEAEKVDMKEVDKILDATMGPVAKAVS